jgi:UDP-glucose 4-epimerase
MKIFVTGGAGYIGSHAVRRLLGAGHEVVVFDNLIYGHRESVPESVRFVEGELSDKKLLERTFEENEFDAVMHFAGFAYVGESVEKPGKYFWNNVVSGLNLLDACVKYNVKKFIFSSSCAVYGTPLKLPIVEDEKKDPESPYGETKFVFENFLRWYDKAHGLKYVSLRYFNAAGADESGEIGEDHDPETHLIPLVLDAALGRRGEIKIFGTDYETPDGTCVRDYIHVNDLADVHVLALDKLGGESKEYNVGVGEGYSVKEIIDMAREITGKEILAVESSRRAGDPPELYADSSKLREDLGWEPKYDLRKIIESAWNWHKKRFGKN